MIRRRLTIALASFVSLALAAFASGPAFAALATAPAATPVVKVGTASTPSTVLPVATGAASPGDGMLMPEAFSGPAGQAPVGGGVRAAGLYPPLSGPAALPWTRDASDTTPTHYYVWCDSHVRNTSLPRDANGIPMIRYWFHAQGPVYNPTAIGNDALNSYETYLHVTAAGGSTRVARVALTDFLAEARWLRDKGMDGQGRLVYRWDLVRRDYRSTVTLRAPWYSAMAQGLAISVFARAYACTGDTSFVKAAKLAFHPFEHDIKDGGVTSGGGRWYEEYPDGNHVLNGSIFAMFGVYDVWRLTKDPKYKTALDLATDNLARNASKYESHGAILYELVFEHFSQPNYYILQNSQLESLAVLTGDTRLRDIAKRWETQFRAYPAPEFQMRTTIAAVPGTRVTLAGTLMYFFRNYYPVGSRIIIRARPAGSTGAATTLASLPISTSDDTRGTFRWVTPVNSRSMWYEFSLQGQPTRAPWLRYVQNSWARVEVQVTKPVIGSTRIANDPGTPNGDGWHDSVSAVYTLGGSPSMVTVKYYDASWRRVAMVAGKVVGGKQALQWNGTYYSPYGLVTSTGVRLGDGMYYYLVEARNSLGTTQKGGSFFVCRDIVPGRTVASSCRLTSVGPEPSSFSPASAEKTTFKFTNASWAWVTIKVFGARGLLRTVCVNSAYRPGDNGREWDGTDNAGRRLPAGNYRYLVFASAGGRNPPAVLTSGVIGIR